MMARKKGLEKKKVEGVTTTSSINAKLVDEISQNREIINRLSDDISKLHGSIAPQNEKKRFWAGKDHKKIVADKDSEIKLLHEEIRAIKKEEENTLDYYKKEFSKKEDMIERLALKLKRGMISDDKENKEILQLKDSQINSLKSLLKKKDEKVQRSDKKSDVALRNELLERSNEVKVLRGELTEFNDMYKGLLQANKELKEKVSKSGKEVAEINSLNDKIERLEGKNKELLILNNQIMSQSASQVKLENEVLSLTNKNVELNDKIEADAVEIKELRAKVKMMSDAAGKLREAGNDLTEKNIHISKLETEIQLLNQGMKEAEKISREFSDDTITLRGSLDKTDKIINDKDSIIRKKNEKIDLLKDQLEEKGKLLILKMSQVEQLEENVKQMKEDLDAEHLERFKDYEDDILSKAKEIEGLKLRLEHVGKDHEKQRESEQIRIDAHRKRYFKTIEELREKIEEKESIIKSAAIDLKRKDELISNLEKNTLNKDKLIKTLEKNDHKLEQLLAQKQKQ